MSGVKRTVWGEGVAVTVTDRAALLNDLRDRLREGRGFSVATLNLDHAVKLRRDPDFARAYAAQTHVTADGNPVVWLSRLAGREVSLVPGSELIEPVVGLCAEERAPVALFGATASSLEATAEALVALHPDLDIAHVEAPAMGFDPDGTAAGEAIARLGASGARVVFLALGAPKQERFAARAQAALPQTGFMSVGAGLDFVSGAQKRAPAWVRAVAAEWLWRLLRNPRRLARRYGACLLALPGLTRAALAVRHARHRA